MHVHVRDITEASVTTSAGSAVSESAPSLGLAELVANGQVARYQLTPLPTVLSPTGCVCNKCTPAHARGGAMPPTVDALTTQLFV